MSFISTQLYVRVGPQLTAPLFTFQYLTLKFDDKWIYQYSVDKHEYAY